MKPEDFGITKYKFNPDGTLDVFQDVNLIGMNLIELPFNFGKIDGYFMCGGNKFKNLKGAPYEVSGDFYCENNNKLTSLYGLNLNGISGKIYLYGALNLKLTEKEQLWMTFNPWRLML